MWRARREGTGRGVTGTPSQGKQTAAPLPVALTGLKRLGPLWQAGFTAAYHSVPSSVHLVDRAEEPGQTSGTYLTHAIDGTGEAVIGNGCIPGLDWPQGLTVREEREEAGYRLPSQTLWVLGPERQPGCQPSRPFVGMAKETRCACGCPFSCKQASLFSTCPMLKPKEPLERACCRQEEPWLKSLP